MDSAGIYTEVADRLLQLAPSLSEAARATVPAPTPDWTVVDTYRDLAGSTVDVLDGRVEGRGSPEWTAAQIAAREDRSLAQICAEWAARVPAMAAHLAADPSLFRMAIGYWTHEQDIRVAVGAGPLREDPHLPQMTEAFLGARGEAYEAAGAPSLRVLATDHALERALGTGAPVLTLHAPAFELLRIVSSRRSLPQCLAADWAGGDLTARATAIEALAAFPLPTVDVLDR